MLKNIREAVSFTIGFVLGTVLFFLITGKYFTSVHRSLNLKRPSSVINNWIDIQSKIPEIYDTTLSDQLKNEVKILCWVATMPKNIKAKAVHVRNTWGKRCNKLLFMSSQENKKLGSSIVALNMTNESRETLWEKTKKAFKYVYENHFNDYEWFMKADDDSYLVMENIRYLLYQFNPNTSIYIGNKYSLSSVPEGYMAGGSYILSKKALQKFVTRIMTNDTICRSNSGGSEDLEMGKCLQHQALAIDGRDVLHQQRFFPIGVERHMRKSVDEFWYEKYQWFNVTQGNTKCCSDTFAAAHYIKPKEMIFLEYLIYHLHPFGLVKNTTESLPRKLSLREVIKEADVGSFSPHYKKHQTYHNIDKDEKYKRK